MAFLSYQVKDEATPALKRAVRALGPSREKNVALGKRAETVLRRHFLEKGKQPNKHGWSPRSFFWTRRVRNSTAFRGATTTQATVGIAEPGFVTHAEGRTIYPREKKFLAIPMRSEAYGIRPSSGLIAGLFVLRRREKNRVYLAKREESSGALRIFYRLLRKVTVPRDPTALPSEQTMGSALVRELTSFVRRKGLLK